MSPPAAVRYNVADDEDTSSVSGKDQPTAANGAPASSSSSTQLEKLLLQKNRRLEHDITMARLQVVDLQQQLEVTAQQAAELTEQLQVRS